MLNPTDRLIKYDCDATDEYLIYLMEALEADDIPHSQCVSSWLSLQVLTVIRSKGWSSISSTLKSEGGSEK